MLGSELPFPPDGAAIESEMLAIRNHMQTVLAGLAELQTELSQLDARLAQFTSSPTPIPVETRAVDESPADSLIDRLEQIRAGCERLLKRPLRAAERSIVLGWVQLQRDQEEVPVEEILELVGRLLSRRTREGTLPGSLAWCDSTVQTLARGVATPSSPRGIEAAAEFATLYEQLANQLEMARP